MKEPWPKQNIFAVIHNKNVSILQKNVERMRIEEAQTDLKT